jgi:hypothetical protein
MAMADISTDPSTAQWLQALTLSRPQLHQLLLQHRQQLSTYQDVAAAGGTAAAAAAWPKAAAAAAATGAGWSFLPSVSPAWEAVAGWKVGQQQQQQQRSGLQGVDLPCLRFFLRSDRDIRAAYIPSLVEWLGQGRGDGG